MGDHASLDMSLDASGWEAAREPHWDFRTGLQEKTLLRKAAPHPPDLSLGVIFELASLGVCRGPLRLRCCAVVHQHEKKFVLKSMEYQTAKAELMSMLSKEAADSRETEDCDDIVYTPSWNGIAHKSSFENNYVDNFVGLVPNNLEVEFKEQR